MKSKPIKFKKERVNNMSDPEMNSVNGGTSVPVTNYTHEPNCLATWVVSYCYCY